MCCIYVVIKTIYKFKFAIPSLKFSVGKLLKTKGVYKIPCSYVVIKIHAMRVKTIRAFRHLNICLKKPTTFWTYWRALAWSTCHIEQDMEVISKVEN